MNQLILIINILHFKKEGSVLVEYDIDGIKVKIQRESNNNSKSMLDCLLDLFLLKQRKEEEEKMLKDKEE